MSNFSHAEKKIFNVLSEKYKGQNVDVNISIQNTNLENRGMCQGCAPDSKIFFDKNPLFNINIYHGSNKDKFP